MNFRAPQDFVRHPVPDAGKSALHEQDRFDRSFPVPAQKFIDKFLIETALDNLGDTGAPPRRCIGSMVKPNATELPGIAKDEAAFGLLENEVIMFSGTKVRLLDPHVSGHAQMQAEKIVSRKLEQNLLSACNGTEEARASQLPNECSAYRFREKSFFWGWSSYSQ